MSSFALIGNGANSADGDSPVVAIIGGTGPEGLGLAMRFAQAGGDIIIGSRSQERADEATAKVRDRIPRGRVRGMPNVEAANAANILIIAVPFEGQRDALLQLGSASVGKILISTVVPLQFEKGRPKAIRVEEGSAAEQAQATLPNAKVVAAFHNLSAKELAEIEHEVPSDVVVCGNDKEAKQVVIALAGKIKGVRGIDGGGLESSRYVEDLTALLLTINRIYKVQSGVRIVGV